MNKLIILSFLILTGCTTTYKAPPTIKPLQVKQTGSSYVLCEHCVHPSRVDVKTAI